MRSLATLLDDVKSCQRCAESLPFAPRPVFQCHASARIMIAGQAPGRKAHDSGLPFNDVSGDRLRSWLGLSRETFYDSHQVAILPMGFCFPGKGRSGDLPPRPECAPMWRAELLAHLKHLELTLAIGRYAMAYHLPGAGSSVTEIVRAWREHWPSVVPLPHPSPRNNRWLALNPWFETELLPALKTRVADVLR